MTSDELAVRIQQTHARLTAVLTDCAPTPHLTGSLAQLEHAAGSEASLGGHVRAGLEAVYGRRGEELAVCRIAAFIEELAREVSETPGTYTSNGVTDGFLDLLQATIVRAQSTSKRDRMRLYARIVRRYLEDAPYHDRAGEYLRTLGSLSDDEIRVASVTFGLGRYRWLQWTQDGPIFELKDTIRREPLMKHLPDLTAEFIDYCLKRIEAAGLLRDLSSATFNYIGDFYCLRDYFREMMAFLGWDELTGNESGAEPD
jgi:hypothetical protein